MGTLIYGGPETEITFGDRALAHLQIVITAKLRRREGFMFTWTSPAEQGGGRGSVWLDSSSTLMFRYRGSRTPAINRDWISILAASSNSSGGLVFTIEPDANVEVPRS
jgi:hypothetical protein